jgi:hypothetical protein
MEDIYRQREEILAAAAAELRSVATGRRCSAGCGSGCWPCEPTGSSSITVGTRVGLSVFDDPHVILSDRQRLADWMVLALEPGVYLQASPASGG